MKFPALIRKFGLPTGALLLLLLCLRVWLWMTVPCGVFQEADFKDAYWRFDYVGNVYMLTPWGQQSAGRRSKIDGLWIFEFQNSIGGPSKWRLETSLMELRAFKIEPSPTNVLAMERLALDLNYLNRQSVPTNLVLKRLFLTPTFPKPAEQ